MFDQNRHYSSMVHTHAYTCHCTQITSGRISGGLPSLGNAPRKVKIWPNLALSQSPQICLGLHCLIRHSLV